MNSLKKILESQNLNKTQISLIIENFKQILPSLNDESIHQSRISNLCVRIRNETILEILNLL